MKIESSFNINNMDDLNKIFDQIKENYEHILKTLTRFDDEEMPKEIKEISYVSLDITMAQSYDEEDLDEN